MRKIEKASVAEFAQNVEHKLEEIEKEKTYKLTALTESELNEILMSRKKASEAKKMIQEFFESGMAYARVNLIQTSTTRSPKSTINSLHSTLKTNQEWKGVVKVVQRGDRIYLFRKDKNG